MRKQELHPRTEVINRKQKILSKQSRLHALAWLAETFPNAFDNLTCIRPLSLGIMSDILTHADQAAEAGISKNKLRQAVVLFTRRVDYLACLKAREMRIDLYGNPTTQVTEDEAERASIKIKKRVEKSAKSARKALNNMAVKPRAPYSGNTHASTTAPGHNVARDYSPYYPERAPAYSVQNSASPAPRTTPVAIKHKTSRVYDPDAVARLKEKLGLSRKREEAITE